MTCIAGNTVGLIKDRKQDKFSNQIENGKCDNEIQRRIVIANNSFQKLSKLLRKRKISLLNCYRITSLSAVSPHISDPLTLMISITQNSEDCPLYSNSRQISKMFIY